MLSEHLRRCDQLGAEHRRLLGQHRFQKYSEHQDVGAVVQLGCPPAMALKAEHFKWTDVVRSV